MKIIARQPMSLGENGFIMKDIEYKDIKVLEKSILSIDGSTTNTGMAILRESDGALIYSMAFSREKANETPVHFKIRLKNAVKEMLMENRGISRIYYEEPFCGFTSAAPNLFMLRAFVEEMVIENEPTFDYLEHYEISNKKWKRLFCEPDKLPGNTELEKKMVRDKLEGYLPFLNVVTQDEIDAISMGFVAVTRLKNGGEGNELESKKKVKAFGYNIEFIGADEDEEMLNEFYEVYSGPKKLTGNGISFTEIVGKTKFDNHVYNTMGQEDKILVIKFSSDTHANLILEHRIGHLAAQYEYLYAIVWRKTRK